MSLPPHEASSMFSTTFKQMQGAQRSELYSLVFNTHLSRWVWVAKSFPSRNLLSPPGPADKSVLSSQAHASLCGRSGILYHVDD